QNFAPPTLEGFLRLFDDFDYGDVGSGHSMLAAHVNSQFDPSRAPPGKATLTLFGFAPFDLRGGASWAARKVDIGRWMRAQYAQHVSNLDERNVLGWSFHTPADMVEDSPTFQRGDVGGVGKFFFQIGGHRPTPELAQYAVPGVK